MIFTMKKNFIVILSTILIINIFSCSNKIKVNNSEELIKIFANPRYNTKIKLAAGDYYLEPQEIIDSTCANCQDPEQKVNATAGLIIAGENITIRGPADTSAVIHTNSGYGLFIKDCENCVIQNLVITDGIRDTSAKASDAAIVVKNSSAIIKNNIIRGNLGSENLIEKNVVGVMGICGRENSNITIENNKIMQNSWDGIALFRDTEAVIRGNYIDGVDKAGGRSAKGGRGVGIGVTWNARAEIVDNYVARYWKGIGIFVDASCIIRNNIVEDLITWGIALWDADKGKPYAAIENNIIFDTGACGVSITSSSKSADPGRLTGNIIVKTAQDSSYDSPRYYCYQTSLAEHKVPENFAIANNVFYDNRTVSDSLPTHNVSKEVFLEKNKFKNFCIFKYFRQSKFSHYLQEISK